MKSIKIGLTGGIGSGKSFIAHLLSMMHCPVYDSDSRAKKLMHESVEIKEALIDYFGASVYQNGLINRNYLSNQVFNNPDKLQHLNAIVHPIVLKDLDLFLNQDHFTFLAVESAILFESKMDKKVDFIVGVVAPMDIRLERTMKRDQISQEAVKSRINNQMTNHEMEIKCDFIIYNDGERALLPQLWELFEQAHLKN